MSAILVDKVELLNKNLFFNHALLLDSSQQLMNQPTFCSLWSYKLNERIVNLMSMTPSLIPADKAANNVTVMCKKYYWVTQKRIPV